MYSDLQLTEDRPVYIQVKDYLKRLMLKADCNQSKTALDP